MNTSTWKLWALGLWAVFGLGLIGYELWCVFSGDRDTPVLTRVVVNYVPWWVMIPFLCWLLVHFVRTYAQHGGVNI
jgi:hypothetical protein